MNKAILIGNITRDLEIRKTQNGRSVLEFSLAINEGYGDKKTTEYVNVTAWENIAERIANYCKKGSKIMVEGRIKTDSYERNGQKIYRTYVIANYTEFLSSNEKFKSDQDNRYKNQQVQVPMTDENNRDMFGRKSNDVVIDNDDLPFM